MALMIAVISNKYTQSRIENSQKKDLGMIKIKISYETPQELEYILRLLHPAIKSKKIKQGQQGAFNKAYITIAEVSEK